MGAAAPAPEPAPPAQQPEPVWPPQSPPAGTLVAPPGMYRARRRRSYLVDISIVLAALLVLGAIGSVTVIAIRGNQTSVPSSAPSAEAIFALPYTRGVRSATFHEVERVGGSKLSGTGRIEFALAAEAPGETVEQGGHALLEQIVHPRRRLLPPALSRQTTPEVGVGPSGELLLDR